MKNKVLLQCAWLAILLSSSGQAEIGLTPTTSDVASGRYLLIEPVTVLSAELTQPLLQQQVLIRDGIIARLAPAGTPLSESERKNLQSIDGSGLYLTPGLMDSHVHVSEAPGVTTDRKSEFLPVYQRQQPRSYLYFGVTQLLDLSSSPDGIATFKRQPLAPDLWYCGAAPVQGGYGHVHNTQNVIYPDSKTPSEKAGALATNTPVQVVERIAASGADCLKIFIEDGFGNAKHLPVYSQQALRDIRGAAARLQLPLFAHANAYDMQRIAIQHHVDVLAHGIWNWTGMEVTAPADEIPAELMAHLQEIHRAGLGYQPTLSVMSRLAAMLTPDVLTDPQLADVVPPALLNWYSSDEAQWFKQELLVDFEGMSETDAAVRLQMIGLRGAVAAKVLYDLGHPLLLASDTPSAPAYSHQPGYGSYLELTEMAKAGIPLHAILAAATINNARLLKLEERYGSVSVGKVANLLLLKQNPLENVEAWNSIATVILHGRPIAREMLSARELFTTSTDSK